MLALRPVTLRSNVSPPRLTTTQRTAPCVTAPASTATFPSTMQVPRRPPLSLSLGSLIGLMSDAPEFHKRLRHEVGRLATDYRSGRREFHSFLMALPTEAEKTDTSARLRVVAKLHSNCSGR